MTLANKLGLRVQRLRTNKGSEYIFKELKKLGVNSRITMEYIHTATTTFSPAE